MAVRAREELLALFETGDRLSASSFGDLIDTMFAQIVPITGEIPAGVMNGTNLVFTLAHEPYLNSEVLTLAGVRLRRGAEHDYTIAGATITLHGPAPEADTNFLADYRM